MDEIRARVHDDLRGLIEGELLFETIDRAPYALDASLYEIDPLGAVCPRSEADVIQVVRYAAENRIPLHARGGGAGLAGGALGPGLVIDFARHLHRVLEIRDESVVVQPGVVVDRLNERLAPLGRRLGPDPGGPESATIGGVIAENGAGARSIRYGTMADHIESLRVVFAHGETAELRPCRWSSDANGFDESRDEPFAERLSRKLGTLLNYHADAIARHWPTCPRNRAGYALAAALQRGTLDLVRLIAGSEGTLAIVSEATLRTVPIPAAQAVVLLPFARLIDAAEAVESCLNEGPSACELHDWRSLKLVREAHPSYRPWIAESAEAALIVEFEAGETGVTERQARGLIARMVRRPGLAAAPVELHRRAEGEKLLRLREIVTPLIMRMSGAARAVPLIDDIAVPPASLPAFISRFQNVLKFHGVNWTLYAHAGHGQLHARPFLNLSDPDDVAKLEPLAEEVCAAALEVGGSVSGEHGCGLVRTQFLRKQYGELHQVFREVKTAFDPFDLLNPGKIVGDDPHLLKKNLRGVPVVSEHDPAGPVGALPVLNPPLRWPERGRAEQIAACNSCGSCRALSPPPRMCPSFRATLDESASPRAQVQILREIATGAIDPREWGGVQLKAHADLCLHCKLCESECPSGIDVSSLMIEAKAAHVEQHGLAPNDWMLSRIDVWSRWASRAPWLFNSLMGCGIARRFLQRAFGLARHRNLPRAQPMRFLRRAAKRGWTRPRPQESGARVAYFVDVFADCFDPELAEMSVALLEYAGVNVFVPPNQTGCGMPALVAGDLDRARALVHANLKALGNAVRDGYTIVCSEPTAALMLRLEAPRLTDDLDSELVARNTLDLGQYLVGLRGRNQLRKPETPIPARVGYHQPCHLRALGAATPGLDLIREIPELSVEFIDRGCSGMAGTFGLAAKNFRTSLRAGRGLTRRLRDADLEIGATECGACRMQMEQGIAKRTYHPVKLLALAHGLYPELRSKLKEPKEKHVIA